jgi:hypothetical protein
LRSLLFLLAVPLLLIGVHTVKANWIGGFNCFNESQCVNGWNNGTSYAVNDWNGGVYAHNLNGGNINCLNGQSLLTPTIQQKNRNFDPSPLTNEAALKSPLLKPNMIIKSDKS